MKPFTKYFKGSSNAPSATSSNITPAKGPPHASEVASKKGGASGERQQAFGTGLEDLLALYPRGTSNPNITIILQEFVEYLSKPNVLQTEGLFRVPGQLTAVRQLRQDYCQRGMSAFTAGPGGSQNNTDDRISCVASLFKEWIREICLGFVPFRHLEGLYACLNQPMDVFVRALRQQLSSITLTHLEYVCRFLFLVANHSDSNRMDTSNIAKIFGVCIFLNDIDGMQLITEMPKAISVLNRILLNLPAIFDKMPPEVVEGAASSPSIAVKSSAQVSTAYPHAEQSSPSSSTADSPRSPSKGSRAPRNQSLSIKKGTSSSSEPQYAKTIKPTSPVKKGSPRSVATPSNRPHRSDTLEMTDDPSADESTTTSLAIGDNSSPTPSQVAGQVNGLINASVNGFLTQQESSPIKGVQAKGSTSSPSKTTPKAASISASPLSKKATAPKSTAIAASSDEKDGVVLESIKLPVPARKRSKRRSTEEESDAPLETTMHSVSLVDETISPIITPTPNSKYIASDTESPAVGTGLTPSKASKKAIKKSKEEGPTVRELPSLEKRLSESKYTALVEECRELYEKLKAERQSGALLSKHEAIRFTTLRQFLKDYSQRYAKYHDESVAHFTGSYEDLFNTIAQEKCDQEAHDAKLVKKSKARLAKLWIARRQDEVDGMSISQLREEVGQLKEELNAFKLEITKMERESPSILLDYCHELKIRRDEAKQALEKSVGEEEELSREKRRIQRVLLERKKAAAAAAASAEEDETEASSSSHAVISKFEYPEDTNDLYTRYKDIKKQLKRLQGGGVPSSE